jgi:hypothetical protein
MNLRPENNKKIFFYLRAVLFTAILTIPQIINLIIDGLNSPRVFNSEDLAYYYLYIKNFHELPVSEIIHNTFNTVDSTSLKFIYPHYLTLYFLSLIVNFTGITLSVLAVLLDIFCSLICYILFSKIFNNWINDKKISELVAIILLGGSFIGNFFFALESNFNFLIFNNYQLISTNFGVNYHNLPILRDIFTQISYVAFGVFLVYLSKYRLNPSISNLIKLTIGSSLLIYIYFYPWVISAILSIYILLIIHNNNKIKHFIIFVSIFVFICSFGLLILNNQHTLDSVLNSTNTINLDRFIYFPYLQILLIVFFLFFKNSNVKQSIISKDNFSLILILLSLSIITHNLQIFSNTHVQTFHFAYHYLMPAAAAIVVYLALKLFRITGYFTIVYVLCLSISFYSNAKNYNIAFGKNDYFNRLKIIIEGIQNINLDPSLDIMLPLGEPFQLQTAAILNIVTGKKVEILEPYDSFINTKVKSECNFYIQNISLKNNRPHILAKNLIYKEFIPPLVFKTMEFQMIDHANSTLIQFNNLTNRDYVNNFVKENCTKKTNPFYLIVTIMQNAFSENDFLNLPEVVFSDSLKNIKIFKVNF